MAKSTKKTYTNEELMHLAIEESHNSIPEHTDKTDPLVGAIVATSTGEILARAHRGELREGEHCEFTLIERKLRDHNLRGCVLYVTLEPCTDDSRKPPKRGCSSHIVKARFSEVYVGVEDPNPKIATMGIRFMESKGIRVRMFPDHLAQQIREDNAQFIEEKEREALEASRPAVEAPKNILTNAVSGFTIESLSVPAIQRFTETSKSPLRYPSEEFNEWMVDLNLAERAPDGSIVPTGLGLMLFGTHPENAFPQTVFKLEINYGQGEPEIRDFNGPLVLQLPEILSFVREKALRLTIDRRQGARVEQADFPFEVLREAITNAVIHRDYSIEGATNYLYINPERIIVRSPGGPFAPITLQDMETFDTGSYSRNPKIMYILNQMKLAEQRGIGLRNMKALPRIGFPRPVFRMQANALEVIFGRTPQSLAVDERVRQKLNEEDQRGVLYIQERDEVTATEYAAYLKISPKMAQRHLSRLIELKLVEPIGSRRWTKYRLKKRA